MTAPPAPSPNSNPAEESKHADPPSTTHGGPGTVTMSSGVRTSAGISGSILLTTSYTAPANPLLSKGNSKVATPPMVTSTSVSAGVNKGSNGNDPFSNKTNSAATQNQQSVTMLRQAAAAAASAPQRALSTAGATAATAPSSPRTEPMQVEESATKAGTKSPLSPRGVASNPASPSTGTETMMKSGVAPATGVEYMDTSTSMPTAPSQEAPDDNSNITNSSGATVKCRRQKRLERNRESARLSRRRRKHYLEVLEERVAHLSKEMDAGRRWHVSQAVAQVTQKRLQVLQQQEQQQQSASQQQQATLPNPIWTTILSRSSPELRVAVTFRSQQSKSFFAPPSSQVVLWLTLQNDDYFRGGRAASERLSAARIGERMLQNGNDKVTPAQTMWPLLCNEIGLSYDQEEKVRMYQRALLQNPESWLARHTSYATKKSMDSVHSAAQALALRIGNRERKTGSLLKASQMSKLQAYIKSKRQDIIKKLPQRAAMPPTATNQTPVNNKSYDITKDQHVAANLYVLNHRLSNILKTIPSAAPLVVGPALKKLSRRPSFESLGARSGASESNTSNSKGGKAESESRPLSRDGAFPSTGSLKRSASEMSIDSHDTERHHRTSVDPMEAHTNAQETVEKHLGHVKEIIPKPNVPSLAMMLPPADRASGILPIHTTSSTPSPPPAVTSSSSPSSGGEQHAAGGGFVPMDDDPTIESFELIAGEPLPDPVPMSVLSSTPAPAFMTPTIPMPNVAPTPAFAPVASHPGAPSGVQAGAPAPHHIAAAAPHVGAPTVQSTTAPTSFLAPALPAPPVGMAPTHADEPEPKQPRRSASSFFPPPLGVVPEEMWSAEAAEDFLMNFVDEDWAIGQGVETDM